MTVLSAGERQTLIAAMHHAHAAARPGDGFRRQVDEVATKLGLRGDMKDSVVLALPTGALQALKNCWEFGSDDDLREQAVSLLRDIFDGQDGELRRLAPLPPSHPKYDRISRELGVSRYAVQRVDDLRHSARPLIGADALRIEQALKDYDKEQQS